MLEPSPCPFRIVFATLRRQFVSSLDEPRVYWLYGSDVLLKQGQVTRVYAVHRFKIVGICQDFWDHITRLQGFSGLQKKFRD